MEMRFMKKEEGVTTIVVIGLFLVLTILAAGVLTLAVQGLQAVTENRKYVKALNIAEAGLDRVLWDLQEEGINSVLSTPEFTLTFNDGIAEVSITTQGAGTFQLKAVSVGRLTEDSSPTTYVKAVEATLFSINIWDMNFAGGSQQSVQTGTSGITGNGTFIGPIFVRGSLPLGGNSAIYEGPVFIREGQIIVQSNSVTLGTSSDHIEYVYIDGDPPIVDKQGDEIPESEWESRGIYIDTLYGNTPEIDLPTLNSTKLRTYRERAENESTDNTLSGTTQTAPFVNENDVIYPQVQNAFPGVGSGKYKVLDSDTENSSLGQGGFNVTIGASTPSFGMVDVDGDSEIIDDRPYWEFAWDTTNSILYINGTVFIDGDLTLGDGVNTITYMGRGTIVVNGDITLKSHLLTADFPQTSAIGLVSAGNFIIQIPTSFSNPSDPYGSNPDIQGAFFALGDVDFSTSAQYTKTRGTIIGGRFIFENIKPILQVDPDLPDKLPPSLPGSPTEDGYHASVTSWREIPPP
jgi:hypothetical protein